MFVGDWRQSQTQVVSGPAGREKIHFEAPPADLLDHEIERLLDWWSSPPPGLDGLLRAGIVHLWFVTLHPFDDGNGRIARTLSEMALAADEQLMTRYYSLSTQIMTEVFANQFE
ncbi:MAG: Fic family protein [Desulfuromusa sp.]|nr:Fic family protein [Desulfuromusa sp.]